MNYPPPDPKRSFGLHEFLRCILMAFSVIWFCVFPFRLGLVVALLKVKWFANGSIPKQWHVTFAFIELPLIPWHSYHSWPWRRQRQRRDRTWASPPLLFCRTRTCFSNPSCFAFGTIRGHVMNSSCLMYFPPDTIRKQNKSHKKKLNDPASYFCCKLWRDLHGGICMRELHDEAAWGGFLLQICWGSVHLAAGCPKFVFSEQLRSRGSDLFT